MYMILLKHRELARRLVERVRDQSGQGMIEYALIAFLIAIAAIVFLAAIGFDLEETFNSIENAIGTGSGEAPTAPGDEDVPDPTP